MHGVLVTQADESEPMKSCWSESGGFTLIAEGSMEVHGSRQHFMMKVSDVGGIESPGL